MAIPNWPGLSGAIQRPIGCAQLEQYRPLRHRHCNQYGCRCSHCRHCQILPRDLGSMKPPHIPAVKRMRALLLALICTAMARDAQAQSSFAGVLLAGNGSGIVAGVVQLSVNGGQVSFQSTLFQAWVANTHLASTLEVQGDRIPFDLGTGTAGNWPADQFRSEEHTSELQSLRHLVCR